MLPLAVALRYVDENRQLRKDLGREALTLCCLQCEMATCNSKLAGCGARQLKSKRQREHYAKKAVQRRAQARRYYRNNETTMRARSAEYQHDPAVLEVMAAKRRLRYAERAAAEGRAVRSYRWAASTKNKPGNSHAV